MGSLTKNSSTYEAFAGFKTLLENVHLSRQLFAQGASFFRFASDSSHYIVRHRSDSDRREYILEWSHQFGFDNLDGDVVDKTPQSNLCVQTD